MRISCAVVCYLNSPAQISKVLTSIVETNASASLKISLTLLDNSPANELEQVATRFGASYVRMPENIGFGKAHNVGIRQAVEMGTDYHIILNPDTYFPANVIPTLYDFMEKNKDIGLSMPDIRYPNGGRQYLCKLLPSPMDLIFRRFFRGAYERSGQLARYELHASGYDKVMDVPALSGCFMMVRTSVLKNVGGFDERFFMYLEDVDLTRRIGRVARTVFYPHVSIVHEYTKGSYKNSFLLLQHIRSAILYFNKWGWHQDSDRDEINLRALQKLGIADVKPGTELRGSISKK